MPDKQYVYPIRSLLSGIQRARRSTSDAGSSTSESSSVSGPMGEPVDSGEYNQADPDDEAYDPRHPQSFQNVVSDAFSSTSDSLLPSGTPPPSDPPPHFNFSEAGIVHLGPRSTSSSGTSSGRSTSHGSGSRRNARSLSNSLSPSSGERIESRDENRPSSSLSPPSIASNDSEIGVLTTARFEHTEDENGHHVITGRGGTLTRCEDEPIRTPGAVQAFGVLIAAEEEDDQLVVRQVSENSTQLLGLSPKYLFGLECLTDTFPDSQAALLWDNIQFMSDADLSGADDEEGPHVFLINGYGEPNSASLTFGQDPLETEQAQAGQSQEDGVDDDTSSDTSTLNSDAGDPLHRRSWTCWCAVHRPPPAPSSSSDGNVARSNLVILEFELEKDIYNPLYPPPGSAGTGVSSTSSTPSTHSASSGSAMGGSAGNSTDGSERTLVGTTGATSTPLATHEEEETPTPPPIQSEATVTLGDSQLSTSASTDGYSSEATVGLGQPTSEPIVFDPTQTEQQDLPPPPTIVLENYSGRSDSSDASSERSGGSMNSYATAQSAFGSSIDVSTDGNLQTLDVTQGDRSMSSLFVQSATSTDLLRSDSSATVPHAAISPNASSSLAPRGEWQPPVPSSLHGLQGEQEWVPSSEDILESTTSHSRPLMALERLRRMARGPGAGSGPDGPEEDVSSRRGRRRAAAATPGRSAAAGGVGMMDVFAVMAQINEQLGAASDLDSFLKVAVGIIKDLTQFHRVLVYQFDDEWNGQTVAELVDWSQTHDLYKGLFFPASDIPAQARHLYTINKVRLLYDRSQTTARLVVRSKKDLDYPLNMTHCYLRAMSPIHIKYLGNMGVRASMSVSIMAFGALWGLVACHSYGRHGMRVSFPVRQMLRLLSQSISRNIERLSYSQRLRTRKLINTVATDHHPTGYIVSNADDLLGLFDADFGILVVGEGAKILGPSVHGQEILIIAEYLRMKQFTTIQVSQAVTKDFPDLDLPNLEVIAGVLYVPLSSGGRDFIAFLRKGQPSAVHWAGKPNKDPDAAGRVLEPRKSFKIWSETVAGKCRTWTDEQLETAGVLSIVYGKFIEVWRQKESALQTTKLTNLLLSNASHEVRTPLNHIINYLEMAMNGPLDIETLDNLRRSHAASKSLLFTINDLLDLTRLESGNETSFNEPFDLQGTIEDAIQIYRHEAARRNIDFIVDVSSSPRVVIGDSKKIRTVVQNLTANALKYTEKGSVTVTSSIFNEPEGLRSSKQTAVEIMVADTGRGMSREKLEIIFREFEQVESSETEAANDASVGLGLAVVARIVEQLGGQLRVDSEVDKGSSFSFLIPLALPDPNSDSDISISSPARSQSSSTSSLRLNPKPSMGSLRSKRSEVDSIVEALSRDHLSGIQNTDSLLPPGPPASEPPSPPPGSFEVTDSAHPVRPVKLEGVETHFQRVSPPARGSESSVDSSSGSGNHLQPAPQGRTSSPSQGKKKSLEPKNIGKPSLRVLIVEDNDINRILLAKRLTMSGHTVVNTTNGQEGYDMVEKDREFDCVLMDLQMPILDGYQCTERIRELELSSPQELSRPSHVQNGRIPIFAVSASLFEDQRMNLANIGFDGWILKPIDFKRLDVILRGVLEPSQRQLDLYRPGCSWEAGGWLCDKLSTDHLASPMVEKTI